MYDALLSVRSSDRMHGNSSKLCQGRFRRMNKEAALYQEGTGFLDRWSISQAYQYLRHLDSILNIRL